jgi:uncharacterized membrane protein YdjX (TVP38/TMEM64 family)
VLLQQTPHPHNKVLAVFRHLGPVGLLFLAIFDSSPIPTFGGPDILMAILVGTGQSPWFECVPMAAVGSTIGAYLTFRLARKAGDAWLRGKFKGRLVPATLDMFQKRGTASLVATTLIPFPFPTSLAFAAAGASNYPLGRFITLVAICRSVRYTAIALLADFYGRHFIHMFNHPTQYIGWLVLLAALVVLVIGGGLLLQRKLAAPALRA